MESSEVAAKRKIMPSTTTKNQARFALLIHDPPASLKLLVNYFRWFGFSFSAVHFASLKNNKKVEKTIKPKLQNVKRAKRMTQLTFKNVCLVAINLACIVFNSFQYWILCKSFNLLSGTFNQSIPLYADVLETFFNNFNDFKSILSMTLRALLHIFLFDFNLNYVLNMYSGGRMIYGLSRISTISVGHAPPRPDDQSLAWRIIGCQMFAYVLICYSGIIFFDTNFYPDPSRNPYLIMAILALQIMNNICISVVPTFFIYAMIEYRRVIRSIFEAKNFGEIVPCQSNELHDSTAIDYELAVVGDRLEALCIHFRKTISRMQLQLTIANISNVYFIISGCCFLLVIDERNRAVSFSAFLFNNAAAGFFRIIATFPAGNLATGAVDELIIELYRHVVSTSRWTVNRWTRFDEIKRLRSKFRPTLFGLFAVRQSTIFAFLAFALNYIVVLLQTETHGKK